MLVRGHTGGMSFACFVFKMINALLSIIPSKATKESQDIFKYAAGTREMMRFGLVSLELSEKNMFKCYMLNIKN